MVGFRSPGCTGECGYPVQQSEYMRGAALESSYLWDVLLEVHDFTSVTYKRHMSGCTRLDPGHNRITEAFQRSC